MENCTDQVVAAQEKSLKHVLFEIRFNQRVVADKNRFQKAPSKKYPCYTCASCKTTYDPMICTTCKLHMETCDCTDPQIPQLSRHSTMSCMKCFKDPSKRDDEFVGTIFAMKRIPTWVIFVRNMMPILFPNITTTDAAIKFASETCLKKLSEFYLIAV